MVTSELFQSEELTDLGGSSFDIAEGLRRQKDIYKAQEILKKVPMVRVGVIRKRVSFMHLESHSNCMNLAHISW